MAEHVRETVKRFMARERLADAAPDLLAACKEARHAIKQLSVMDKNPFGVMDTLDSAIAKAEAPTEEM